MHPPLGGAHYCYRAMGEHVAVRGAITLWNEANRRAPGTREKQNRQWCPKQSDIELQIYTEMFINLVKKTKEKFPSSSLGKNFPFGWCFLENSWTDWQLAVSNGSKMTKTREKGKAKKKRKSLKRLGSTFGHARTKKCHKTGCYLLQREACFHV